jgi:signal recognition particle GTPase
MVVSKSPKKFWRVKCGSFEKLKEGLSKTHQGFVEKIDQLVTGKKSIDQDLLDELEGLSSRPIWA